MPDPEVPEPRHPPRNAAEGLPVAPGLESAAAAIKAPPEYRPVDKRVAFIAALAMLIGAGGAVVATILTDLIGLITNLAYYGKWSLAFNPPTTTRLGVWSVLIPVGGAIIVGLMARYGASAIRGHGIPEVMERVLYNRSRISPKIMILKPLSSAIAIGTGGPFGAEGPIIATGGALGSLVGQLIHVTADERKTLLAAGAAAGMSATFNSPVSAVLLAVELLLFEYRPRSLIPVALASAMAATVRTLIFPEGASFTVPPLREASVSTLVAYVGLGLLIGAIAVGITKFVYWLEDMYEHLPVHWMWWPAFGAVVVGVIGLIDPRTLGVGYSNISNILQGNIVGTALMMLIALKFLSWSIYLGSGTSGGTLAPLFTIGGGIGALLGGVAASLLPGVGMDPHVAALIGMGGIFAGASHALLASIVFTFEITKQPMELLPLLAGCSAAYLVALLLMRSSIMTEKLARRGTQVRTEYSADYLDRVTVRDAASRNVVSLRADQTLAEVRHWLATRSSETAHQGFPVLDADGLLAGVVTRRDLLDMSTQPEERVGAIIKRQPAVVFEENTLREAADHMVHEGVGRLPVVSRDRPRRVTGMVSRSDLLGAHRHRLHAATEAERPRFRGAVVERRPL